MSIEKFQPRIKNYKLKVASRYISIDPEHFERITPQDRFLVSTKYDGHFYGMVHNSEETYFLSPKGKVVNDIALVHTVKAALDKKGIKEVCLVGELYLATEERTRHFNLRRALSEKDENIGFAVFGILDKDGEAVYDKDAFEVMEMLKEFVPSSGKFHLVEHTEVTSRSAIKELFEEAMHKDLEGVVVKGEEYAIYKVKPKYTFDAVVVGFAEGDGDRAGMVRDLLLAFMKKDGTYQVFAHLSHGFNDDKRKELLDQLSPMTVESDYIEVAANKVGFQMIRPELIIEFSCLDVIAEDSKGSIAKINLNYEENTGYTANYRQQSVSVVVPVFLRFREDKAVNTQDLRFSQVEEVVSFDKKATGAAAELPKSEVILRQVYVKPAKAGVMIRKFLIFKTNKEHSGEYPAYVFHLTDVSTSRKDPLKREIRTSNSEEQIMEIYEDYHKKNVKKGWVTPE